MDCRFLFWIWFRCVMDTVVFEVSRNKVIKVREKKAVMNPRTPKLATVDLRCVETTGLAPVDSGLCTTFPVIQIDEGRTENNVVQKPASHRGQPSGVASSTLIASRFSTLSASPHSGEKVS